jgi:uncharacterized membrane protein HdeD (DUF308 family)
VSAAPSIVSADAREGELANMRRLSSLFVLLGSVSMLIGFLAIGVPHIATTKTVMFIGILLVIAGVIEAIHAVMVRNFRGFAIHLLAAALYMIVGLFVLEDPERAAGVLTLLLSASFFAGGVLRIAYALAERFPAWLWVLFNGAVNVLLGVLIWRGWPDTKEWVIGLFVGIELVVHGWSWVALGLTVRFAGAGRPTLKT